MSTLPAPLRDQLVDALARLLLEDLERYPDLEGPDLESLEAAERSE